MSCLVIMAGGTGGHVYPALAVARLLRDDGVHVIWLGTRAGMEARVVPEAGFDIQWITIKGLRGKGPAGWLLAPVRLVRAMWQSIRIFRGVRPGAVLGMGGFVSGPGGVVAKLRGSPRVLHEQNASAGLTNKVLARIANRVLTGFPSVPELPANAEWVGNPVREGIEPSAARETGAPVRILVTGGSQGALALNRVVPPAVAELKSHPGSRQGIEVWHQAGRGKVDDLRQRYSESGVEARVTEFIEEMDEAYAWADLVVCRAGAMTVAELCAAGLPAILIPYPWAVGDHQARNAEIMVEKGAGVMLREEGLDPETLASEMAGILYGQGRLQTMGRNSRQLHMANAAERVAGICLEYLQPGVAHA